MNNDEKKEYMKKYYLENKQVFLDRNKKNMKPEKYESYYSKNKNKIKIKQKEYLKATNYKNEKTELQRKIRSIKRKTRYHFPLQKDTKCQLCNAMAQCHHHNTEPIKYDKFNFFCNKCHNGIHSQLNFIGGK